MDIATISTVVAAVGVIVGIALTYLEVRSLVQARQTDLLLRVHSAAMSNDALQARKTILYEAQYENFDDYRKKYFVEIVKTASLFEALGILVQRKLADVNMVTDLFPVWIFWEKLKQYVEDGRKRLGTPKFYEWFEYIHNEVEKTGQKPQIPKTLQ